MRENTRRNEANPWTTQDGREIDIGRGYAILPEMIPKGLYAINTNDQNPAIRRFAYKWYNLYPGHNLWGFIFENYGIIIAYRVIEEWGYLPKEFDGIVRNNNTGSVTEVFENLSRSKNIDRHPITQVQIDDILNKELKNLTFPVHPIYNPRIRANGITKGEVYPWGELKRIVSIEVGKQDNADRKFLTDTLLHEYYEAHIMMHRHKDEFIGTLAKSGDTKRHRWIYDRIAEFFREMDGKNELG